MSGPVVRPPAVTARLLRAALPAERRDEVLEDLEERFGRRVSDAGASRAARWYRVQAITLIGWGLADRMAAPLRAVGSGRGLLLDVRVALRTLLANPGYTSVAVITLALGIGGNTAVFSVVDGVLLRPLPFAEAHELVAIHETRVGNSWWSSAPVNAMAWRERSRALEDVAWGQAGAVSLRVAGQDPLPLRSAAVSANMFGLLEVRPHMGRLFEPGEDVLGGEPLAVLPHSSWIELFGADPEIVGRRIELDGVPHTVIGVLPPGGQPDFLGTHDVVVPRPITEAELQTRGRILQSVGRLADGVSLDAAREEMAALGQTLDDESPAGTLTGWGVRLVPLKEQIVGSVEATLLVLLGAVGFVLLVACANLGNLMLARGSARARDLAVRTSLGAGRARLVRHLLLESALIGVAGAAAGLVLAMWATGALLAIDTSAIPRSVPLTPDGRVLGFTAGASLLAVLLFGLAPALRVTRVGDATGLLRGGGRSGESRRDSGFRSALVSLEVALVVVLLVGAGMMLRSIEALNSVDPGFEAEDRIAFRFTLPASRYPTSELMGRFVLDLVEHVRALPGVAAAGAVSTLPLSGGPGYTSMQVVRSHPAPPPGEEPLGGMEIVSPGYFETMGIPILAGRDYTRSDTDDGLPRIIVDGALVERDWPDGDPLTDALRMAPPAAGDVAAWREVIGVVGAVHYGLDAAPRPRMYLQEADIPFTLRPRTLVVRAQPGQDAVVIDGVRRAFADADPLLPIDRVENLEDVARSSIARPRLQSTLLAIFAAVALALGAVGVYGVVAYSVARRTREVGVRLAVGASRASVLRGVMRGALVPVVLGLGLGLVAAAGLSRLVAAVTFGVAALDPLAFTLAPAALLPVATLAALLPGLRATRIDPVRALREE